MRRMRLVGSHFPRGDAEHCACKKRQILADAKFKAVQLLLIDPPTIDIP